MTARRAVPLLVATLVVASASALASALVPTAAAATCTRSWTGGDGSWSDPAKWSGGVVPQPADVVCVTAPGTYTVTVEPDVQASANAGLTIGGSSGTQTVLVQGGTRPGGTPAEATLFVGGEASIEAGGVLELRSGGGANPGRSLVLGVSAEPQVVNRGVLRFSAGGTGVVDARVALRNEGLVDVGEDALRTSTSTFTNVGTIALAAGRTFEITGSGLGPIVELTGGELTGSGRILMTNGRLTHTGTSMVGPRVDWCVGTVRTPGPAAGSFRAVWTTLCGAPTLAGDIGASSSVVVDGTGTSDFGLSLESAVVNRGTLELTGSSAASRTRTFGNPITNEGTLRVTGPGPRLVGTSLTNHGVLDVASPQLEVTAAFAQSGTGTLDLDVGPEAATRLKAQSLALDGTLKVDTLGAVAPPVTIAEGTRTGVFAATQFGVSPWTVDYQPAAVVLQAPAPPPPPPPPPAPPAPANPTVVPPATAVPKPPATTKPRCRVPSLKNRTVANARKALTKARCRLGKVTRPKGVRSNRGLVVRRQSRKVGATLASHAKVDIVLGRKPPARRSPRG